MKSMNASVGLIAMMTVAGGCLAEDAADETVAEQHDESRADRAGALWLNENFDALGIGPLNGQNGWTTAAGDSSCVVFPSDFGNAAKCTPAEGSGQRESSTKQVPAQTFGNHNLQFSVRSNENVVNATAAKLTLNAVADGSVKIVQIFNGTGMRMTSGTGATAWLYASGEPGFLGAWIDVSCTISLAGHTVTCAAGPHGAPPTRSATLALPANATAIASVDLFAWDVPGAVLYDNLVGVRF